jgi:hypothetical protein
MHRCYCASSLLLLLLLQLAVAAAMDSAAVPAASPLHLQRMLWGCCCQTVQDLLRC